MKDKAGSCLHLTVCNCATWTGGGRGATGADHAAGAPLVLVLEKFKIGVKILVMIISGEGDLQAYDTFICIRQ